jgi:hypothetical protein
MRRLIALIALAGLLAFAAAAPASAASKRARCVVKHSHTVAKNRFVRVYYVRRGGNRRLSGCRRATGRKVPLAAEYDDDYVESGAYRDVRLAGRFVAFVFDATDVSCKAACPPGYEATETTVVIRNIRVRQAQIIKSHVQASSLRLSAGGVAAWLAPIPVGFDLDVFDGASYRAVDTGAIDPASVALAGLHLSWTNAGVAKTAELTPR